MRTAGIDLSSRDEKSAACVVEWLPGQAAITSLALGVDDAEISRLIGEVEKVGIDVPLGWPIAFVEAVSQHSSLGTWPETYRHTTIDAYRYRRTDVYVWRTAQLPPPLSVSTDRIGVPAMRAAALLAAVNPRVELDGSGVVVEVYPAAALRRWSLTSRKYKGPDHLEERRALVASFEEATGGWLSLGDDDRSACETSDDVFDALVAALVARAAAIGAVDPIPLDDREVARREGWIALPRVDSLVDLPGRG